ncbi:hypothetical protein TSTA_060090 [Talaromyces stipitatus ATCC 10500]|uniref:Uncharacterized protein n=1 Tax=Talaromyces stipitatus (strain ATCC 10500 / CBS 375.48 / QM 6759 / NRRL 1006) TaxID=441959 RepID=B8LU39_TALSN|nr:uncharacterized protein TSTA_060090 [Talaromyces stipitatus ATCC 10500]EED22511.1 hypothetical protein TSTA_060090 [Talaromyces stipitatus ATCC 10500]
MANEMDEWLNAYNFDNDYMPAGITNEPSPNLQNQASQATTGAPWVAPKVGRAPPQTAGIDPDDSQEEELSDESETENKLLEERVRSLEESLYKYRKGNLRMNNRIRELPSRRTLKILQAKLSEMSKNIEGLQSKFPEIYAKDKTRDLQHTQLSGKVENLQVWASDMKETLDKAVNAMKYMRGENENTVASNRQRNNHRIRRSRAV